MQIWEKPVEAEEDLADIRAADVARAEGGEPIPWEKVKAELREKTILRVLHRSEAYR